VVGLELLVGLAALGDGLPIAMVTAGGIHEAVLADRVLGTLPLAADAAADVLERIAVLDRIAPQVRELRHQPAGGQGTRGQRARREGAPRRRG
jgi:hypothetical protein